MSESTAVENNQNGVHSQDHHQVKYDDALHKVRTAGAISMTPDMFESLYLSPKNRVSGDLRSTFGNPTPIALAGFLLCTTPLSMILLGWRGAGGLGAAVNGAYFFLGGMLLTLGGIGEWILGNTFPATVFISFGGFWATFGATLVPFFNAYGAYATAADATASYPLNLATGENPEFFSSFAFFLVGMGILCVVYCVASVRTNICFFFIFLLLIPTFACLAGAFWQLAQGNMALSATLQHAGAALLFVVTMIGWWIFFCLVLLSVDFPFGIPLGDLSGTIKGATDKKAAKEDKEA